MFVVSQSRAFQEPTSIGGLTFKASANLSFPFNIEGDFHDNMCNGKLHVSLYFNFDISKKILKYDLCLRSDCTLNMHEYI